MANPLLTIAIIDMYDGNTNVGMDCIVNIIKNWSANRNLTIDYSIFKLREANEIPNENFDIYISSGGPGSPLDSIDAPWDKMYTHWLEQMMTLNKPVFLICHSFQLACRHFNLGTITLRKSRQIGILPIHPLTEDIIFSGLEDPFYALESRDYQIIAPNDEALANMGANIIALEKIRPQVPLERAIMGIRFNENMIGVQFHPEGEPAALQEFFQAPSLKNKIIEEFGIEKWENIITHLQDPHKIQKTATTFLPNFLDAAMKIPLN
ncbi:MAG: GMP synthase [Chitinophagia bacterium]|jgi:GMP synthase-like glutamine amidotransferase